MGLDRLARIACVLLVSLALVGCDGSENARNLPTAGPEYVSPAEVGPGNENTETESHGEGTETQGETTEHSEPEETGEPAE
jgi:hypothetical protein